MDIVVTGVAISTEFTCSLLGGGNGKSKYFNIIKAILGSSCMNIGLKELTKEKFAQANLCDKTCNISPDETNIEILDTGTLKRLSGGDNISTDKKYAVDMVSFKSVVKLLISMNEDLSFNDNSKGFSRRVKVIPFNNELTGASCDTDIESRLLSPEVLQIIAYRAMVAFKDALKRGELTLPASVKDATDKYIAENDPIGEFVKWYLSTKYYVTYMLPTEFRDIFDNWCKSRCISYSNISDDKFRKGIINHKFTIAPGTENGIEDVYVYTPDYKDGEMYNPNITMDDCCNCIHCGNSTECSSCIKKQIFGNTDTALDVRHLLYDFYNALPDDVKDKYLIPKSVNDLEEFDLSFLDK